MNAMQPSHGISIEMRGVDKAVSENGNCRPRNPIMNRAMSRLPAQNQHVGVVSKSDYLRLIPQDASSIPKSQVLELLRSEKQKAATAGSFVPQSTPVSIAKTGMQSANIVDDGDDSLDSDDEDTVLRDDARNDPNHTHYLEKVRKKRKRMTQWVMVQVFVMIGIAGSVIASLFLFPNTVFWSLVIWKWLLLCMVIMSGKLISRVLVWLVITFMERYFLHKNKLMYIAYGLRKCVMNSIWVGQVVGVWFILFDRVKSGDPRLFVLSRVLLCVQFWSILVMAKVVLIKTLANNFHRKAYFERIKDAMFAQYVLERLSIPADLLMYEEPAPGAQPGGEVANAIAGNVTTGRLSCFIRFIKNTNMTTILHGNVQIETEAQAKSYALEIFDNILRCQRTSWKSHKTDAVSKGSEEVPEITEENLSFFVGDDAERAMNLMSAGDKDLYGIDARLFLDWVWQAVRERKALALTLSDNKTALSKLQKMLDYLLMIIVPIIGLFVFDPHYQKLLVLTSSGLLAAVFVFGNSCKILFENLVFVFVNHKYDVGDTIRVENVNYTGEEMSIMETIVLSGDNSKVYFPNNFLALKPITNLTRSSDQWEANELTVGGGTTGAQIAALKQRLQTFVAKSSAAWYNRVDLVVHHIRQDTLLMTISVQHRLNFGHNSELRNANRNAFLLFMNDQLNDLEIRDNGEMNINILSGGLSQPASKNASGDDSK
jgi:hypothetical protein